MALQLEIVTPKGSALTTEADEVTAPSVNGEFGVLPGHLPLLASLRTGIVVYRKGSDTMSCAVGPGFAEVLGDKVVLLTDDFAAKEAIDPVAVRQELNETEAQFQKLEQDTEAALEDANVERREVIKKLNWLVTLLELYGEPPAAVVRLLEDNGARVPSASDPDVYLDDSAPSDDGAAS